MSSTLLTIPEVADRTGRAPELLRRWAREGRIPAVQLGRDWLVSEDALPLIAAMPRRKRPAT